MSQPYVGQISMFAGNFPPSGWMFCQGQLLPISEYETLFNLIGTTYGGDGQSTFALPDLQSRIPLHFGTSTTGTTYQLAQSGGVETVTLNTQQIPQHNHVPLAMTPQGNLTTPAGNALLANEQVGLGANSPLAYAPFDAANQVQLAPTTVANVGGSQSHENVQPILAINYIISLFGVFPTQ